MMRTKLSTEFSNSPDNQAVRLPLKFKYILTQYPNVSPIKTDCEGGITAAPMCVQQ